MTIGLSIWSFSKFLYMVAPQILEQVIDRDELYTQQKVT